MTSDSLMSAQKNRDSVFRRGFTLLEVLISAVIFTFLIIGITEVLNIGNWAFPTDLGWVDLQQQSRQAMGWMTKELREGKNIQITVINTDSDQITFNTIDKNGVKYYRDIDDVNNDGVVNQVIREYPAGTRKILANYITRLKFSQSNPILRIDVRSDQTVRKKALSFSLTEQLRLRNE